MEAKFFKNAFCHLFCGACATGDGFQKPLLVSDRRLSFELLLLLLMLPDFLSLLIGLLSFEAKLCTFVRSEKFVC